MNWSNDQDTQLRQYRQNGHSFGWIAKFTDLGRLFSKNSLIGRAARLALPGPEKPAHALPRYKPKHFAPRVKKRTLAPRDAIKALAKLRSGPAARHAPLTNSNGAAAGEFLGLSILELNEGTCRYPDGEPITFCGQLPLKGSPYCAKHHAICFCK